MSKYLKKLVPQKLVNNFKHKPVGIFANLKYKFPSRKKIKIIGVTGTDGKTTTINIIYHILKSAGKKVSMVSTINAVIAGKSYDTGFHVTSPSSLMIQKMIRLARKNNDEFMVLEVTSHALDQHRFWGVKFDIGVVTNVTHEHLDYHKTFENYLKAKSKLIKSSKMAVLNKDDKNYSRLAKISKKVINFGFDRKADFNDKNFPLNLKIPGNYNILNGLAAAAVCSSLGLSKLEIQNSLKTFSSLKGRMEEVKNSKGIRIFIDFAHTPNGLEQALKTLRQMKKNKIIALIGAEGERDVAKRPLMGEIAQKLADYVVITSIDPRGQIDKINQDILKGSFKAAGKIGNNLFVLNDRMEALDFAINKLAKKDDIIGIFGKGHETSINLDGKAEVSWSDLEAVQQIINGK